MNESLDPLRVSGCGNSYMDQLAQPFDTVQKCYINLLHCLVLNGKEDVHVRIFLCIAISIKAFLLNIKCLQCLI